MLYIKDEGIIITKKPHKEKDAIVIILTKKYGKVRALATGLRRQESRILGLSEPGTIAKFYFAVSSGKSITSSNIIRLLSILGWKLPGKGFKKHPYLFLWALRFLATINVLEVSDELWHLILNLDKAILKEPAGFQVWFILKVLEELGEMPNFEHCHKCSQLLLLRAIFPKRISEAEQARSWSPPTQNVRASLGHSGREKVAKGQSGDEERLLAINHSNHVYFHRSSLYCQNCKKPSYESISQKDLILIKKIIHNDYPIFPYPAQLKKLVSYYLSAKK